MGGMMMTMNKTFAIVTRSLPSGPSLISKEPVDLHSCAEHINPLKDLFPLPFFFSTLHRRWLPQRVLLHGYGGVGRRNAVRHEQRRPP